MKTYTGYRLRTADGVVTGTRVVIHEAGREFRPLDPRRHLPDGFEWEYAGSGPAQLALDLAADARRAVYQALKFKVVSRMPADGWSLMEDQARGLIAGIEGERERRR